MKLLSPEPTLWWAQQAIPVAAPIRPHDARRFAVLTCMDARLDPTRLLGVPEDSTLVLRNAGGRVTNETLQGLILSHQVLGTREWFLIQHTDCGVRLPDAALTAVLSGIAPAVVAPVPASFSDLTKAVATDLAHIQQHPHVPAQVQVYGYVYDLRHNQLLEVQPARHTGS